MKNGEQWLPGAQANRLPVPVMAPVGLCLKGTSNLQIETRKLYMQIAEQIRLLIESGVYQAGDKLPTLAHLAEQFSCSRATVREALSSLRGQGLVEFRHGDGTYVRTAAIEMWMEPLEAAILLGTDQVEDLVHLHTSILAGIATLATRRRNPEREGQLAQGMFQVECANPEGEDGIAAELAFYTELALYSGSVLLGNTLRILQESLRSSLRLAGLSNREGLNTCRAVYDAVLAGDAPAARNAIFQYGASLAASILRRRAEKPPTEEN